MFKKKNVKINPNTTDTVIGEGTNFEGRIKSEASLRIEGHLTGDIECIGDVIIGEHGMVKSNINARNVTIAGVVSGNVTTKGTLNITATGQLFGNTISHSLVISEGGIFQGQSKMLQDTNKPERDKENTSSTVNPSSYNQPYSSSSAI